MMSNDIRIFCRPCDFEIAKQLLQAGLGVITTKSMADKLDSELPKSHIFDPKYAEQSNFGDAQTKPEGGMYRGYEGRETMVKVTEQEFLSTIVDRSGVTVEQAGHKHKHYLFCGNHYASKIKGQYWVVDSVYKEILKGEESK